MAKFDITHSCGDVWTWNITGKSSYREWMIKQKEQSLCPECWKKQAQEADAVLVASSAESHPDWPELTGTEKQVAWALSLRQQMYDVVAGRAKDLRTEEERAMYMAALDEAIREHIDSTWFIDRRWPDTMRHALTPAMSKAIKRMQQEEL